MTELSRFELINHSQKGEQGRQVVYYGKLRYEIQDEGRTLKVFLESNNEAWRDM